MAELFSKTAEKENLNMDKPDFYYTVNLLMSDDINKVEVKEGFSEISTSLLEEFWNRRTLIVIMLSTLLLPIYMNVLSVFLLLRLDYLVNGPLYSYGLLFSQEWYGPYKEVLNGFTLALFVSIMFSTIATVVLWSRYLKIVWGKGKSIRRLRLMKQKKEDLEVVGRPTSFQKSHSVTFYVWRKKKK